MYMGETGLNYQPRNVELYVTYMDLYCISLEV